MEYLENDKFAFAGFEYAKGEKISPEDWPSNDVELDFFNAGIYQCNVVNGTNIYPITEVKSPKQSGCESNVSLHPANWR